MASVYVPLADITAINGAMKDGQTVDQAVQSWADKHPDLLKRWGNIKNWFALFVATAALRLIREIRSNWFDGLRYDYG